MKSLQKQIDEQQQVILDKLYETGQWKRLYLIKTIRGIGYGAGAVVFWVVLGTLIFAIHWTTSNA